MLPKLSTRCKSSNFNDGCELVLWLENTLWFSRMSQFVANAQSKAGHGQKSPIFSFFGSNSLPWMHVTCFSKSPGHIWVENIVTNIHIWPPGICRGSETRQFCACKQYLLTENLSDEGLGRIFWIADIPMSSPPILSNLCPPSLRLCPSMPSKSQVKSIIVLSVSTSTVHHPPSVKLKSIFSHPTRLQPPRFVLWN